MAMQKRTVSMPFTKGLDTKTDPRLSMKLSRLENMVIRNGTLEKRPGTTPLPSANSAGGSQSSGEALFNFNGELTRINGGTAYGLSSALNQWVAKGGAGSFNTIANTRVRQNTNTQVNADSATAFGVTVYAWQELDNPTKGIHVAVRDNVSGTFYQSGDSAITSSSDGGFPRCVVLNNRILVFWVTSGGKLWRAVVKADSPTTAISSAQIETDYYTNAFTAPQGGMDAVPLAGFAAVAYAKGSGTYKLIAVDSAGAVKSSPATVDSTGWHSTSTSAMCLGADSNSVVYLFSTAQVVLTSYFAVQVFDSTFTPITFAALGLLKDISPIDVVASCTAVESATSGRMAVFFNYSDSGQPGGLDWYSVTISSTAITTAVAAISGTAFLGLVSTPIVLNGTVLLGVVSMPRYTDTTQVVPTGYVMDSSGNLVAKVLPGLCNYRSGQRAGRPMAIGAGAGFIFPERGRLEYVSSNNTVVDVTPVGVTQVAMTPAKANQLPVIQVGNSVYVGGASPRTYDGSNLADTGFHQPPGGVHIAATGASGGHLSAGTYQWRAVYSWVDEQGQLWRSPASPALTGTANADDSKTIYVVAEQLNPKDLLGAASVQLEVYRTEANQTTFYRVSSPDTLLVSSSTGGGYAAFQFVDTVSDANLVAGELLYTTGGVNDWFAPPAYSIGWVHRGRLMVAGLEDAYSWQGSSVTIFGQGLRFNPGWGGRLPAETGPIVGGASMDGNCIIFTTEAAYAVVGDGPDLLGNNNWPEAQRITSVDSGCVSSQSILSFPGGILFKAPKGWCLLDRALQANYLGADVEAFNGYAVRCATLRPEVEELWLQVDPGSDLTGGLLPSATTSLGGIVLSWNYHYGQWGIHRNYGAQSACYYGGNYTRVRSDGAVLQERPGTWLDSNAPYVSLVETAWFKTAGLQGFQRIWHALLEGAYNSDFTVNWDIGYNYQPDYAANDSNSLAGNGIFSVGGSWQVRRHLRLQKCEALRFRIYESAISGNGEGMGLTDVTLEFGVKGTAFKLPASQSI